MSHTQTRNSYFHRGGETPLLGQTIPEFFGAIAEQYPDHEAVVSIHQGRRLNYRELAVGVDELARGLLGTGFGKGDRIGVWSTNNIEWLLLQMATARIGAILVNIKLCGYADGIAARTEDGRVQQVQQW
jgi:fatty-acyl-CoA synthase